MRLDTVENKSFELDSLSIKTELNKGFESTAKKVDGIFVNKDFELGKTDIAKWIGTDAIGLNKLSPEFVSNSFKQMYNGIDLPNGNKSLGLKEISQRKGTDYSAKSSKGGFAAEIVSTAKENMYNELEGNGIKVYRADDRPDLFPRNDQYVDKIRVDKNGEIIERIQTKFVGKNGQDCYKKLCSKGFDKYFNDGKVDKMEIPKDYYNDVKKCIDKDRTSYKKQLERVSQEGKTDVVDKIQSKLNKLDTMDKMLEQSNTNRNEAIQAGTKPKAYLAKQMLKKSSTEGVRQAETAMIITGAISTVDNVSECMEGNISPEEAVQNIAKDTGTAAVVGYGVGFVSNSVASTMAKSSNQLIREVGNYNGGCIPAIAVAYGIEVHSAVSDYAEGVIDNEEFVDELCRSGAKVAGGIVGSGIGAVAGIPGSYAGGVVGSKVGEAVYDTIKNVSDATVDLALGDSSVEKFTDNVGQIANDIIDDVKDDVSKYKQVATGLISNTVGYVVTSEAYKTAVESMDFDSDKLNGLENKASECVKGAVEKASALGDSAVANVKEAFKNYNIANSLPFSI
ncbi:MAG: hypothetical protein K5656_05965 [Lachnospiraceae bacterium]|nr:hypothetical protein [Lachnospiraceae bacterium]